MIYIIVQLGNSVYTFPPFSSLSSVHAYLHLPQPISTKVKSSSPISSATHAVSLSDYPRRSTSEQLYSKPTRETHAGLEGINVKKVRYTSSVRNVQDGTFHRQLNLKCHSEFSIGNLNNTSITRKQVE